MLVIWPGFWASNRSFAGALLIVLLGWVGLAAAKYHAWTGRYGQAHEPNGKVPRDHGLTAAEKNAAKGRSVTATWL